MIRVYISIQTHSILTTPNLKKAVFWDVRQCSSVRIKVSKERIASIIRVKGISKLGTTLAVGSYKVHMTSHPRRQHSSESPPWKPQILHSINRLASVSETNVFPVRYELGFYIPEDGILQRKVNLPERDVSASTILVLAPVQEGSGTFRARDLLLLVKPKTIFYLQHQNEISYRNY
jgi:hypothetical protein